MSEQNVQTAANSDITDVRLAETNCREFHGSYLISVTSLFQFSGINGFNDGVVCKCPGYFFFITIFNKFKIFFQI